jgi:hypothetical protein
MSYKIYKTGAFVIVEDSTSNLTSEFNSQSVQIEKLRTAVTSYDFLYEGSPVFRGMFLTEITDGSGNPYTSNSFDTFRFTQVGKQNVDGVGTQGPTGATGAQGPTGATGAQGPVGPVGPAGLDWKGTWISGTSYVADDAVGYSGASYFCTLATSGTTTPNLDTTHWALLASQGAVGPQGPTGPQGTQGIQGAVGPQGPTGATGPAGPQGIQGTPGTPGSSTLNLAQVLTNGNSLSSINDNNFQGDSTGGSLTQSNAFGFFAGFNATGANANFIGSGAGYSSDGAYAIGIGAQSLNNNNGDEIIGIGRGACDGNSTDFAIGIGSGAMGNNQGYRAIGIGYQAGFNNTGNDVVAIGNQAGVSNLLDGVTMISNSCIPSFANHTAAASFFSTGAPGNTYLYYNNTTNAISAVRT